MSEIGLREPDDDLIPLIRKCSDEELDPLVGYITQKGWVSSELDLLDLYKQNAPHHSHYRDEIAAEIQKFGGNTIWNILRGGKGVSYKEIVCDVADRLKVNYNKERDVDFIENQILFKVLEKAWEKMTDEEKRELYKAVGLKGESTVFPKTFPQAALQGAIKAAGFKAYQVGLKISLNIANEVSKLILGKGLSWQGAQKVAMLTTQSMKFLAGPIGWAVTGIMTLFQIAAPAYRVTVPCVLHIAMLRQLHAFEETRSDK